MSFSVRYLLLSRYTWLIYAIFSLSLSFAENYQTEFEVTTRSNLPLINKSSDQCEFINILAIKRTGSTLTYSIVTELTGRECHWSTQNSAWKKSVRLNRGQSKIHDGSLPILGSHYFTDIVEPSGILILTLRDYKDLFSRDGVLKFSKNDIKRYFNFLDFFDKWDPKSRFIVHFEELTQTPTTLISKLADFLNADPQRTSNLILNFPSFKEKVFKSYQKFPGGSKSVLNRKKTHSSQIPRPQLLNLENKMKNFRPYLYKKYLTRYSLNK